MRRKGHPPPLMRPKLLGAMPQPVCCTPFDGAASQLCMFRTPTRVGHTRILTANSILSIDAVVVHTKALRSSFPTTGSSARDCLFASQGTADSATRCNCISLPNLRGFPSCQRLIGRLTRFRVLFPVSLSKTINQFSNQSISHETEFSLVLYCAINWFTWLLWPN